MEFTELELSQEQKKIEALLGFKVAGIKNINDDLSGAVFWEIKDLNGDFIYIIEGETGEYLDPHTDYTEALKEWI